MDNIKNSVHEEINELEKFIISEDRDDGSILSDIDPDINTCLTLMIPFITPVDTITILLFVSCYV